MEIKDNKLTINIPEGMEIDLQNSNFTMEKLIVSRRLINHPAKDINR